MTGKYCSGKNALVSFLLNKGFSEIDVDRVGHRILADPEVKSQLRRSFGSEIFSSEGAIDRPVLGGRVFRDFHELRRLESIVHPPMVEEVKRSLQRLSGPVVVNAAVLFRMGLEDLCDAVVCVRAPLIQRLKRARRRDGASLMQVLRRLRAQRGICPKLNANGVDIYYVDNDRGLDHLHTQILKILREKGQENR
ncbi:MAG: dephospho-CoA kinase [Spirochaetaceae bacterium]|nr:MAG: dephospho-CoA kinase [Spirochaetaceae bacterium]